MPTPSPASGTPVQSARELRPASEASAALVRGPRADSPAEAEGRRILSTAFVRVGPGGHLTVELRDGRVLVLRDVVMGPRDYCGAQVAGDAGHARYCGGYAEVAAARAGGGPAPGEPDLSAGNLIEPTRD